jgi:DNA gyrase subunit A
LTSEDETKEQNIGRVLEKQIGDEMKESYINYAMSVIIGRALPDVRDGLKPVHRRILYGMHAGGHTHDKTFTKSARSVGEVMGKFHPHGDQSIYDTMVRMAQDFSLRYPLVDGQGNFGSIDGDPPAAMRYTESRLDRLANSLLSDIEKNTVDFQPNFDDSEQEPSVLPAGMPNLLLNGSDGIAVGMATKIPPHNLTEMTSAIRLHIDTILEQYLDSNTPDIAPEISVGAYMEHLKGPDFPTGATIYGIDGIRDMYETGHGKFHVRSDCEVEENGADKKIIVHAIPYQVKKSEMLEKIAKLVSNEHVKGIRDIRDESSKEGIRVVIEVKQNADPHAVLNQLYKSSRLQESYSANMMGIINGQPVQLTLPVILHTWVRHRESVVQRRTQFELTKAQARIHLLQGLLIVAEHGRDITDIIRDCEDYAEVHERLAAKYDMSEIQTKAVYEMPLGRLTRQSVGKLEKEQGDLEIAVNRYKEILASRKEILTIVMDELDDVTNKHGDERRTSIDPMPLSMDREDLIEEKPIVITLSQENYLRHARIEEFRLQNRAGTGLKGVTTKDEDVPQSVHACFSKDRLLIFTDQGRVYGLRAWETPQASRQARGRHVKNLLEGFRDEENIVAILPINKDLLDNHDGIYLMFATKNGRAKRTALSEYVRINRNGKYAIKLVDDDALVAVRTFNSGDEVVLISANGMACRFYGDEARSQGRVSQGVKGMSFKFGDDRVAGMIVTNNADTQILTVSRHGMGKRTRMGTAEKIPDLDSKGVQKTDKHDEPKMKTDGYRRTKRGAKGVKTMMMDDNDEIVTVRHIPDLDDQLFLLAESGMMIRIRASQTKETTGRVTRGTRLMELRARNDDGKRGEEYSDKIIGVARLPAALLDDESNESETDDIISSEEE